MPTSRDTLISVIVPVYNAMQHIAAALSSIQQQTYDNWECTCVDDGSKDESSRIVGEFVARDTRFRLIRQANGGPGAARNSGLEAARGTYFTFVDADDLLHPEMLAKLLEIAISHGADLAVCDFIRFRTDDEFAKPLDNSDRSPDEADVNFAPLLPKMVDWKKFRVHPWGKLYHRGQHGSLRFPHLCGPEDAYASFDVYGKSQCAVFTHLTLYGYRIVEDGLTQSVDRYRNYITGYAEVAIHCEAVLNKHGVSTSVKSELVQRYVRAIVGCVYQMSINETLSATEKRELLAIAHDGIQRIKRFVGRRHQTIAVVNYVAYSAICLRALWLLHLWRWVKRPLASLVRPFR